MLKDHILQQLTFKLQIQIMCLYFISQWTPTEWFNNSDLLNVFKFKLFFGYVLFIYDNVLRL